MDYPDIIKQLPEADIPFDGVKGYLLQGEHQQVVYFEIEPIGEVPAHKHGDQWGVIFEGEMELTTGDTTRVLRKGDQYFVSAGVMHSATFKTKTYLMDVFEDKDRYKAKL
ncbi:MAG: cupin domain-containing protein [Bacteroidales bacterium]|nr:cupin domain-containing protein [Bacteroidales bacterium]